VTTEADTKFEPVNVKVKSEVPGGTVNGEIDVTEGAGLGVGSVSGLVVVPEPHPETTKLTVKKSSTRIIAVE